MALPSTNLGISLMNVELGFAANQANSSVKTRAISAGFSAPYRMGEWIGYSAGDTIVVDWANPSTPVVTSTTYVQYYSLIRLGQTAASTVRPQISLSVTAVFQGSASWHYSINSTSVWTLIGSRSSVGSTSYYIPASAVSYTNILRLRISITKSGPGSLSYTMVTLPSYILGTGTVNSYTASGLTNWAGSF